MTQSRGFQGTLIFTMAVLSLTLGAATAPGAKLKGKVKDRVYYPPAQNFSVPLPDLAIMQIADSYQKAGFGAVSFSSLFGPYLSIHYMLVPPELKAGLAQPESREKSLVSWLQESAMPMWFLQVSPSSKLLYQAMIEFEGAQVLMGLIEIPEGSALTNMGTGKRLDARRAFVVFPRGSYMYILFCEATGRFGLRQKTTDVPTEDWPKSIDRLKPFFRSISFKE